MLKILKFNVKAFYVLISFALVIGCASYRGMVMLRDMNQPLQTIQKMVSQSLPKGPAKVLKKGRLFVSKPFIIEEGQFVPAGQAKRRYYVRVFIRGSQRPYTLDVEGVEERFTGRGFQKVGRSDWIAKGMARIIHRNLTQRRKEQNMIDSFRPF